MKRHAIAIWEGTGKDGKGTLSTQSTLLSNAQYSYLTRFENGVGTNPEELVAAAHAGCFSMKLAFILNAAGYTATKIDTRCDINLDAAAGVVTKAHLTLNASVEGITAEKFAELAEEAKVSCPISKLLNAELSLDANLN
jgi:lipoyl-dependent peroxiredoxin